MKVYISPYQLEFKNGSGCLQGALLLFEFQSGLKGHGDLLPWPRFREKSLKDQLEDFKRGKESPRLVQLKKMAFCDALARKEKRSLFSGLKIPDSHFLIEDAASFSGWDQVGEAGYQILKAKIRPDNFQKQLKGLKKGRLALPHCLWRLDLNGSLNFQEWDSFKKSLQFLWNKIEFIEDPFKNPENFSGQDSHLFAEDWISFPRSAFRIVKPSRDSLDSLMQQIPNRQWRGIIFTHSQETLLGQAATAWQAGTFYKNYPSFRRTGAFKCYSFKKHKWTLNEKSHPVFQPPSGFGLGYGSLLEKESWKRWV